MRSAQPSFITEVVRSKFKLYHFLTLLAVASSLYLYHTGDTESLYLVASNEIKS